MRCGVCARRRLAQWLLLLTLPAAPIFAQESQPAHARKNKAGPITRDESRMEAENNRLYLWKWANFVVLAAGLGYIVVKNGGPFFAARSRQIRKDMVEAAEVRKEAEERAFLVDRKLANLAADIASLRAESERERAAATERLKRHREAERAKIQAYAEREIESAGKAARLELKRFAAELAVELAEQKIRARMTSPAQDALVAGFVNRLSSASPSRLGKIG